MLFHSLFSLLVLGFGILQVTSIETHTQIPSESPPPISTTTEVKPEEDDNQIVDGHVTTISSVPYLVYLSLNGKFICGGSLVAPRFVVSAAHCVVGMKPREIFVVGGSTRLPDQAVRRRVDLIVVSKAFNMSVLNMDVSILRLASSLTGKNIKRIGLCNSSLRAGSMVQVSGWSLTSENGNVSPQVRSVTVPLVSAPVCEFYYQGTQTAMRTMFCAGEPGKKDACNGHSGGPLVYEGRLCGIVSWRIGCERLGFPGVYTNVSVVGDFIRKVLKKHSRILLQ